MASLARADDAAEEVVPPESLSLVSSAVTFYVEECEVDGRFYYLAVFFACELYFI